MAAIKLEWGYRGLYLLPLLLFLILSFMSLMKGRTGPCHEKAVDLWNHQRWTEIQSMSENLFLVGKSDPECMYLAMMAASNEGSQEKVQFFADRLARRKLLNWQTEAALVKFYRPDSFRNLLSLYRTRASLAITLMIVLLLVVSWRVPGKYFPLISLLSLTGVFLLIL